MKKWAALLVFCLTATFLSVLLPARAKKFDSSNSKARQLLRPDLARLSVALSDGTRPDRFSDLCQELKTQYILSSNVLSPSEIELFLTLESALDVSVSADRFLSTHNCFCETNHTVFAYLSPAERSECIASAVDFFKTDSTRLFDIGLGRKFAQHHAQQEINEILSGWADLPHP